VILIFDGGKSAKPAAVPLFSKQLFELHLRVEFKIQNTKENNVNEKK